MNTWQDWAGAVTCPGYALERATGGLRLVAPDMSREDDLALDVATFDPAAALRLAEHRATMHWRRQTDGGREVLARTGLRVLQWRIARAPVQRDLRAAALLVLHLDPADRVARLVATQYGSLRLVGDAERAHLLGRARELAPRVGFAAGGPVERLRAYVAAFDQSGQPRWYLTPPAWRDLASLAGGIAVVLGDACLAELSCRVSSDGEAVSMSASEIDELVEAVRAELRRVDARRARPRRRAS